MDDPDYGTFTFPEAIDKLAKGGLSGFSEASTRADILALLGQPDLPGGGVKEPQIGYIFPWIVYRRNDCQLRFDFDKKNERIRENSVAIRASIGDGKS